MSPLSALRYLDVAAVRSKEAILFVLLLCSHWCLDVTSLLFITSAKCNCFTFLRTKYYSKRTRYETNMVMTLIKIQ